MKLEQTFAQEAKDFILKACKQRLLILRHNLSKNNDPDQYDIAMGMQNDISILTSDRQFANYLYAKGNNLIRIMPGQHCKGMVKRMQKFNELLFKASQIKKNQIG